MFRIARFPARLNECSNKNLARIKGVFKLKTLPFLVNFPSQNQYFPGFGDLVFFEQFFAQ